MLVRLVLCATQDEKHKTKLCWQRVYKNRELADVMRNSLRRTLDEVSLPSLTQRSVRTVKSLGPLVKRFWSTYPAAFQSSGTHKTSQFLQMTDAAWTSTAAFRKLTNSRQLWLLPPAACASARMAGFQRTGCTESCTTPTRIYTHFTGLSKNKIK